MSRVVLILKGILLWVTIISSIIFLTGGFVSLVERNNISSAILWLIVNIGLCYGCWRYISFKEFSYLSGADWLDKNVRL